jgi:hypothetical protein
MNAMHIGETVDSLRLRDVLTAYRKVREMPAVDPEQITIAGKGISGALGLYAAILEPEIMQVLLLEAPTTHRRGPIFLNILRHTDLPEAAALLAPRRLLFYSDMPEEYEYTKRIYELHGKPEHMMETMTIEYAILGRYNHDMASGR